MFWKVLFLVVALFSICDAPALAQDDAGPGKQELSAASYYTEQFEQAVERARGKPFDPKRFGSGALERVAALVKRYPDNPEVLALKERVRQCLLKSKGDYVEITPEMLAYRNTAEDLRELVAEKAAPAWTSHLESLDPATLIENPFPAPDLDLDTPDEIIGKKVTLTGFQYPYREFTNSGTQYVAVGTPGLGHYFVKLTDTAWSRMYPAIQRYRSDIGDDRASEWVVTGTITGVNVLVPTSGDQGPAAQAYEGWEVEPEAIHIPNVLTVMDSEDGGATVQYAGESLVAEQIHSRYTDTAPPAGEDPQAFVEAFIRAIKEKNFDVFIASMDPSHKQGPRSLGRLRNLWRINQERFADLYVHVAVEEIGDPYVIRGEKTEDLESIFLTDEDIAGVQERADALVEAIDIRIKHYDEKGKQVLAPNTVKLRRYEDLENNRWFVYDGFPL